MSARTSFCATQQLCVILQSTALSDKGPGGAELEAAKCCLLRCRLRLGHAVRPDSARPERRSPTRAKDGPEALPSAASPSVLLTASTRMLYSWILSLWCWNSFFRFDSSSLENFPELFACWTDEGGLCETHAGLPSALPQRREAAQVHTLFHSLSSLGSSKASPSLTSWSFRELLSTDRVSLFPSMPYLVRITAQPNTDALAIDCPDSLAKGAGPTPSREEAPIQRDFDSDVLYVKHFNVTWIDLPLKIPRRSNRSWQQLVNSEHISHF